MTSTEITLSKRIAGVQARATGGVGPVETPEVAVEATPAPPPAELTAALEALAAVAQRFDGLAETLRSQLEDGLAALALAVARKILVAEVKGGNYDIIEIVNRVLEQVPSSDDVAVRVHPDDLAALEGACGDDGRASERLRAMRWTGDPSLGRAECVVETPSGFVESLIETQLSVIDEEWRHAH